MLAPLITASADQRSCLPLEAGATLRRSANCFLATSFLALPRLGACAPIIAFSEYHVRNDDTPRAEFSIKIWIAKDIITPTVPLPNHTNLGSSSSGRVISGKVHRNRRKKDPSSRDPNVPVRVICQPSQHTEIYSKKISENSPKAALGYVFRFLN
jgi:hypothetical protein